jgi:predicted GNAT family N-acyltransferase
MHRLEYARKQWPEQAVSIDTSQHTTGFYQHLGFKVIEWKKDGYGPGLDRVELIWKPD